MVPFMNNFASVVIIIFLFSGDIETLYIVELTLESIILMNFQPCSVISVPSLYCCV